MRWRGIGITILALGTAAAVLAVVIAPLFDLDRFSVPKELALHLCALALLGVLAARKVVPFGIIEATFALFAGWSLVSGIFATNHWLALRSVTVTTSGLVVFVAARALTAESDTARRALGWVLVSIVLVAAGSGLAEAGGWQSDLLARTRSPGGVLGNRNFLAHLMVLGTPIVVWLTHTTERRWIRLMGAAAIAVQVAMIVLSRSRASWLGLAAAAGVGGLGLLVAQWRQEAGRRPGVRAVGVGAVLGLLGALAVPNQLEWRSDTPYRDSLRDVVDFRKGSGRGRLIQYQNSLELVKIDPVFGTGPGNWAVKYPLVTSDGDPSFAVADPMPTNPWPSSDWVAVLTERGPAGLFLGLFPMAAMGLVCLRRLRAQALDERMRAVHGLALVVGLLVVGLFDAVLLLVPPTVVAFAALALLVPHAGPMGTLPVGSNRGRLPIAIAVVLTVLGATRSGSQLASMIVADTGSPRALLESAIRYDPASYRLHVLLALRAPCPTAAQHAERAARLYPYHPAPPQLAERCSGER